MAITDYASLVQKMKTTRSSSRSFGNHPSTTSVASRWTDVWAAASPSWGTGAAFGAAINPARNASGAMGQYDGGSTSLRLLGARLQSGSAGTLYVVDRLAHSGGCVGNVATPQTAGLPTAALTRYTSGENVIAFLRIASAIGSTATTFSVSYTDQDGVGGNASPLADIGGTGLLEANRLIPIPLAAGDRGIRSVESITFTATTGTAGDVGILLCRPLMAFPIRVGSEPMIFDFLGSMGGALPDLIDGTCLGWLWYASTTSTGIIDHNYTLGEDDT